MTVVQTPQGLLVCTAEAVAQRHADEITSLP